MSKLYPLIQNNEQASIGSEKYKVNLAKQEKYRQSSIPYSQNKYFAKNKNK